MVLVAAENAAKAMVLASDAEPVVVIVRTGHLQPGDNLPSTLGSGGSGTASAAQPMTRPSPQARRNGWVSNEDFAGAVTKVCTAPELELFEAIYHFYAVSNNRGSPWSTGAASPTACLVGYRATDDAATYEALKQSRAAGRRDPNPVLTALSRRRPKVSTKQKHSSGVLIHGGGGGTFRW